MNITDIRQEYFKTNESLREVEKIRQDILKRGITNIPEHQLADAVLTLSMYMVNIGQLFVDLACEADDDEEVYKTELNDEFLRLKAEADKKGEKLSDTNASNLALANCKEEKQKSLDSRAAYNFVMRYYKDIERIISTAQSKMRVGSSEMIRSNAS